MLINYTLNLGRTPLDHPWGVTCSTTALAVKTHKDLMVTEFVQDQEEWISKGFWNFMAEDLLDWCQMRSEMMERGGRKEGF